MTEMDKPTKVFISHRSTDVVAAEAVVDFLENLGVPAASIVCTSVPDHLIPNGKKIYDWLRSQFTDYNLHVLFLLSKAYYDSPDCLNEMGAAWATKTKSDIILLPGFSTEEIRGCVGSDTMSIYWDGQDEILTDRISQLRNTVCEEFGLSYPADRQWNRIQSELIEKIRLARSSESETEGD